MSATAPRNKADGSAQEGLSARKKVVRDSMLMHLMSNQALLTSRQILRSSERRRCVFSDKLTDSEKHDYFAIRFAEFVEERSRREAPERGEEEAELRSRRDDLDRLERQAAARVAVSASIRTGDILPRRVYELAGAEVPENATDMTQRKQTFLERVLGRRH